MEKKKGITLVFSKMGAANQVDSGHGRGYLLMEVVDSNHGRIRPKDTAVNSDGTEVAPGSAALELGHSHPVSRVSVTQDAKGNLHITLEE